MDEVKLDRLAAQAVALAAGLSTCLFFWSPGPGVDRFLNSDLLYLPALFADLADGGRISDWILTPSPYVFPDMAVFSMVWLLTRSEHVLPWAIVSLQALAWAPAIMAMSTREALGESGAPAERQRSASGAPSWIPAALALHLGLSLLRAESSVAFAPFLVLTYHAGQALLGGLLLGLLKRAGTLRYAVSLLLIFVGSLSDPFFVIGFAVALSLAARTGIAGLRAQLLRMACVLVVAVAGLLARQLLPLPPQHSGLLSWSRTLESLEILRRTAMEPRGQLTIVVWAVVGLIALGVWRVARAQRAQIVWASVAACSIAGAVAIGAPTAFPDSRYLTAHTIALAAIASVSFARLLPLPRLWLIVAITALLHSGVIAFEHRAHIDNIGKTRNKFVECFQEFREEADRPLSRCVAGYWASKPISLFAEPPVVALQVKPNGTPDWFISTRRHFSSGEPIDCAVFPASEVGHFTARFGPPSRQKRCDSVVVLGYFDADQTRLNEALQPVLAQPAVPSPFF